MRKIHASFDTIRGRTDDGFTLFYVVDICLDILMLFLQDHLIMGPNQVLQFASRSNPSARKILEQRSIVFTFLFVGRRKALREQPLQEIYVKKAFNVLRNLTRRSCRKYCSILFPLAEHSFQFKVHCFTVSKRAETRDIERRTGTGTFCSCLY